MLLLLLLLAPTACQTAQCAGQKSVRRACRDGAGNSRHAVCETQHTWCKSAATARTRTAPYDYCRSVPPPSHLGRRGRRARLRLRLLQALHQACGQARGAALVARRQPTSRTTSTRHPADWSRSRVEGPLLGRVGNLHKEEHLRRRKRVAVTTHTHTHNELRRQADWAPTRLADWGLTDAKRIGRCARAGARRARCATRFCVGLQHMSSPLRRAPARTSSGPSRRLDAGTSSCTCSPWCSRMARSPATPSSLPRRARSALKVSSAPTSQVIGFRRGENTRTCIPPRR